jgi:transposase
MEDLEVYREDKGSKGLNGRLHRWGYRRFQRILECKARLHGLNVKYIDPSYTSSMCPVCGGELDPSPNRCRLRGLREMRIGGGQGCDEGRGEGLKSTER